MMLNSAGRRCRSHTHCSHLLRTLGGATLPTSPDTSPRPDAARDLLPRQSTRIRVPATTRAAAPTVTRAATSCAHRGHRGWLPLIGSAGLEGAAGALHAAQGARPAEGRAAHGADAGGLCGVAESGRRGHGEGVLTLGRSLQS